MVPHGERYRVAEGCLLWRNWDRDESVVYHVPSGETHLLNEVAASVLRILESSALSPDELYERVTSASETVDSANLRRGLADLLEHFDELGLICAAR